MTITDIPPVPPAVRTSAFNVVAPVRAQGGKRGE